MRWLRLGLTLLALGGLAAADTAYAPAPFPQAYRVKLEKFAVLDRVDGKSRDAFASPAAVQAVREGREFPPGAVLAIDLHAARRLGQDAKTLAFVYETDAQGRLKRTADLPVVHLMQKTAPGTGTKTWAFGGYDPFTQKPLGLQLPGDCLECHQLALADDMVHTLALLRRYAQTGQVQYAYCRYPGRQPC